MSPSPQSIRVCCGHGQRVFVRYCVLRVPFVHGISFRSFQSSTDSPLSDHNTYCSARAINSSFGPIQFFVSMEYTCVRLNVILSFFDLHLTHQLFYSLDGPR